MPAYRSPAEGEVRDAVVARLRACRPNARIIHEINCSNNGPNRIDLIAVDRAEIIAVEVKSAKDNLDRLDAQVESMRKMAHHAIAAVHEKFLVEQRTNAAAAQYQRDGEFYLKVLPKGLHLHSTHCMAWVFPEIRRAMRSVAAGYDVVLSDLVDYGTADRHGEVQAVVDFFDLEPDSAQPDIVTNPPYGALLNRFVAHALRVHRPRKMALLLNLNFVCGFDDPERNFAMDENPPARIHVFTRRLPMMHRDGWDGPEASSRMNTAWFVWEADEDGNYVGPTVINRVDWADYQDAPAIAPLSMPAGDDLYRDAVALVVAERKASCAFIQRRFGIGWNRASALVERMEREGVVSAANGGGKRDVLAEEVAA